LLLPKQLSPAAGDLRFDRWHRYLIER
jgi:hypothetical protein